MLLICVVMAMDSRLQLEYPVLEVHKETSGTTMRLEVGAPGRKRTLIAHSLERRKYPNPGLRE